MKPDKSEIQNFLPPPPKKKKLLITLHNYVNVLLVTDEGFFFSFSLDAE